MFKFRLIIPFLFSCASVFAEDLYVGETSYSNQNTSIYFDQKARESIFTIDSKPFVKSDKSNLNFGFYNGRIWIKFQVNESNGNGSILELKNPLIDLLSLYQLKKGKWKKLGAVGDIFPYSQRNNKHRYPHFTISSGGTYLLKIESKGQPLDLKLALFTKSKIQKRDYRLNVWSGIFYGILLFVFVFNCFMFLMLKRKNNFILVCYLFCMSTLQLTLSGHGYQLFWGEYPYFQNHAEIWFGCLSLLFFIQFSLDFIGGKGLDFWVRKFLRLSMGLLLIILLISLVEDEYVILFTNIAYNTMTLILAISIVPIAIIEIKEKFKQARLVLVSLVGIGIGICFFVFTNFGVFQNTYLSLAYIQMGVVFQVMFLTFAVLDRYKLYKQRSRKNLLVINELNESKIKKLEFQVKQRTEELISQKEEMETINREIVSSINYANRIQVSLIPSEKEFLDDFLNGFVCFRPKDIVSGDFYWSTKIKDRSTNGEIVDKIIICLGDTNDLGVPGAVLSVLALRIAQEVVGKEEVNSPGLVLSEINKEFNKLFSKIGADGERTNRLSCTICVIDPTANSIEFAGANSSIFLESDGAVSEIESPNKAIGQNFENESYVIQNVNYQAGDSLYLKTDGFEKQLKIGANMVDNKGMKELLEMNSSHVILQRKLNLLNLYEKMLKKHEQIDDICVIAIQF